MASKMQHFTSIDDVYTALENGAHIEDKFSFSHIKKTNSKSKQMSLGRIWFNLLLPDDYELIDHPVDKGALDRIIKKLGEQYTPDTAADLITKINQEAFKLTTYVPSTFSIDSMILPDDIKKEKEKFQNSTEDLDPIEYSKRVDDLSMKYSEHADKQDHRINNVLVAGVKGDPKVWGALMFSQGYVSDIEGNTRGPIKTSLSDGHTPSDFYTAAAEGRRGFYFKAAISADPGYLARRVRHVQ